MTYNYHQSRGRRVIENTFGILTSRWRILLISIRADNNEEKALLKKHVLDFTITWHKQTVPFRFANWEDKNGLIKPGEWHSSVVSENTNGCFGSIKPLRGCRQNEEVLEMRKAVMEFLNSDIGSVLCKMITLGAYRQNIR